MFYIDEIHGTNFSILLKGVESIAEIEFEEKQYKFVFTHWLV